MIELLFKSNLSMISDKSTVAHNKYLWICRSYFLQHADNLFFSRTFGCNFPMHLQFFSTFFPCMKLTRFFAPVFLCFHFSHFSEVTKLVNGLPRPFESIFGSLFARLISSVHLHMLAKQTTLPLGCILWAWSFFGWGAAFCCKWSVRVLFLFPEQ